MKNLNKVEAKKLFENIDLYSSLNAENCSDLSDVNKPQVEYIDEGGNKMMIQAASYVQNCLVSKKYSLNQAKWYKFYFSFSAEEMKEVAEEWGDEGALDWDFEHVSKIEDEEQNLIYEA